MNLTNIVKPITDTTNKVIDNIPSDNNTVRQATELLQNTKDVDLVNANKFGNQFDFKNPRS
jgi:hypothetical protein